MKGEGDKVKQKIRNKAVNRKQKTRKQKSRNIMNLQARAAAHAEGEVLFKHHGNRLEEGKARGYDPNWFLEVWSFCHSSVCEENGNEEGFSLSLEVMFHRISFQFDRSSN